MKIMLIFYVKDAQAHSAYEPINQLGHLTEFNREIYKFNYKMNIIYS
jgi:hypothetical protein